MAVDNTQKLLIGLAVVGIALYFVNQKEDPETIALRKTEREPVPEVPKRSAQEALYRYLTGETGPYKTLERNMVQLMQDLRKSGTFVWPLGNTDQARVAKLLEESEKVRDQIMIIHNAVQEETKTRRPPPEEVGHCENIRLSLRMLINNSDSELNAIMVEQKVTQYLRFVQNKIMSPVKLTQIFNQHIHKHLSQSVNIEKAVIGQKRKHDELIPTGQDVSFDSHPAKVKRLTPVELRTPGRAQQALLTNTAENMLDLTKEDKDDGKTDILAIAQPGKHPPPKPSGGAIIPLPRTLFPNKPENLPGGILPPVMGADRPPEFAGIQQQKTTATNPPPKQAPTKLPPLAKSAQTTGKRGRDFTTVTTVGEGIQGAKKRKQGDAQQRFNKAPQSKTGKDLPKEGDVKPINTTFDGKVDQLVVRFNKAIEANDVKQSGLNFWDLFRLTPLGDEETGYYTNSKTGEQRGLDAAPNSMFQNIFHRRTIPTASKEVARAVTNSPEFKKWNIAVNAAIKKQKVLQAKTGKAEKVQLRKYYEKL